MQKLILFIFSLTACFGSIAQTSDSLSVKRRGGAVSVVKTDSLSAPIDSLRPTKTTVGIVQSDTLAAKQDSAKVLAAKKGFVKRFFSDYRNPKKAMLCGLIFPGGGQIYNKRWWKLPLVYGAFGTLLAIEKFNLDHYRQYKRAYFNKVNELPVVPPDDIFDAQSLKARRDGYRKNLETSSLLLGLTYVLSIAEAFVDAHLSKFDISDDLSFRVKPLTLPPSNQSPVTWGVGVAFNF